MSFYHKNLKKKQAYEEYPLTDEEMLGNLCRNPTRPMSPKGQLEQEKRLRREIANSNERRRMQSINAGFNSLKTMIPHPEGEKLSKAAILQQTADYINSLQQEKNKLASQNSHLKRLLGDIQLNEDDYNDQASPPPKRKKRDTESSDEGINMPHSDDASQEEMKREMVEIRSQLDRERCLRMMLEDQMRRLEAQIYPEKLRHIASHVSAQMRHEVLRQKHLVEERRKQEMQELKIKEESKPVSPCSPTESDTSTLCGSPPPQHNNKAFLNSYMSRRNLDMIVEAIRHLEGEQVLLDRPDASRDIPNSEDSEKESTITLSDHEDCKSDSLSGRESPLSVPESQLKATVHVQHNMLLGERYPTATQLLHHPNVPPQFLARPGVIVQKTS